MVHYPLIRKLSACLVVLSLLGPGSVASEPVKTTLAPLATADATLTITTSKEAPENILTTDEIEALQAFQMITTTPWRTEPTLFAGVLLRDLLEAHGLAEVPAIVVQAENDYSVEIPRTVWTDTDIMVVTRANGERISRRERGPLLFMVDADTYETSEILTESHLVWMVSDIAPAP